MGGDGVVAACIARAKIWLGSVRCLKGQHLDAWWMHLLGVVIPGRFESYLHTVAIVILASPGNDELVY